MKLIRFRMLALIVCACFSTSPVYADDAQELQRVNELNTQVLRLYKMGKYDQAIDKGKEALGICERVLGPVHPKVASALNNLALLYKLTSRYAEAEFLYRRALAVNEKSLGPAHPDVAINLNNLAGLYQYTGRYAEAETLYKRALAIDEKSRTPEQPDVANRLNNLAGLYETTGRYAEAEPLYKRALAVNEKALGTEHPYVAAALNNLAGLYKTTGRYAEAEPLYKRALAINEKALGPEHPDVATNLNNLAELLCILGRYAEAEPLYKRALAIDEKALGPEHPDVSTDLNNLAALYKTTGRYAEAEPLYRRALAIVEKTLGPAHPDVANRLNNLAVLYVTAGRYSEAEPLYRRALAIVEKALGPEHPDVANRLNNLAVLYKTTGRYAEAEPLYKRALAIDEKALGPEHSNVATDLNNLAMLYCTTDRYAEAEPLYKRALTIVEKAHGSEHHDVATALDNLAGLYDTTGRYAEAEPLYKHALAIDEKALGPEHPDVAPDLNNLAVLYWTTGRYAEAEQFFKRALAIDEKAFGPEHPNIAKRSNNLAVLYFTTGRYAEAEPLYRHALAIVEKALGPEHHDVATAVNNLAKLCKTTGRYAEAEQLFKRTLAIDEKALGPEHHDIATTLDNLAALYYTTGRYAEAEPLFKRALAIDEKVFGPEHPDVAKRLNSLALLYETTGRYAEAEPLYRRALAIAQSSGNPALLFEVQSNYSALLKKQNNPEAAIFFGKQAVNTIQGLRANVSKLGKKTLKTYTETVEQVYKRLANLLIEQGRLAEAQQVLAMLKEEEYFQYIRRDAGDSGKLDTKAAFTAKEEPWLLEYEKLSANNARLGKELGELRAKDEKGVLDQAERARLNQLLEDDQKASEAFNAFITRLISSLREEADKLARQSQAERDKRLAELSGKNLAGSSAMMQTLADLGEGAVLIHYLIMDERVHILLTTPDSQLARHSDIKSKVLNSKISALRDALTNPNIDPRPLAKELYTILIAPVAKDLQQAKARTLMLSLDGTLRYLPFAALYDGKEYLVQQYRTVMYSEVSKDKIALAVKPTWKVAALGVSDKVSDAFTALPSVVGELSGIVKNGDHGVIPGEIHLNAAFTAKTLQQSASRNPVVHIASHFRFTPGTEMDSFLLLGDGSRLTLDKVRKGAAFRNTELLTLSACETAMGNNGTGSEIEGFGAIAMERGAKSVIATLWSVADVSTSLLMKEFYRLKEEKKLPKVEALRQAQLSLLNGTIKPPPQQDSGDENPDRRAERQENYAHPFFWAPFILMGNWK
jgi:tetratricopeptide (TPR) repeat protein